MNFFSILQALLALIVTLSAFSLCVVAMRRYGPDLMKKLQATQGPRRIKVVESVMLDQARKLVLVDIDGVERLVLIGDARFADAVGVEERKRPTPAPKSRVRKAAA